MRNVKIFAAAIACLFVTALVCSAYDYPIPPAKVPAPAQAFLKQHFPDKTIIYAEKDVEFLKTRYEVNLDDGTHVVFYKDGDWDKVDGHNMVEVPAAILPAAVKKYVKSNCVDAKVTKIDKERYGYDVELSNGMEMKFNRQGALFAFDD